MEATQGSNLFSCQHGNPSETHSYRIGHKDQSLVAGLQEAGKTKVEEHLECIACFAERFGKELELRCSVEGCKYVFEKEIARSVLTNVQSEQAGAAQTMQSALDSVSVNAEIQSSEKKKGELEARLAKLRSSGLGGMGQPRPVGKRFQQQQNQTPPPKAPDSDNRGLQVVDEPLVAEEKPGQLTHATGRPIAPGRKNKKNRTPP